MRGKNEFFGYSDSRNQFFGNWDFSPDCDQGRILLYEALLAGRVRDILNDSSSPVLGFVDKKKAERFLESPSDYGKPWYGQLMAAPQLMAYLIQVDFWMREYHVTVIR